MEKKIFFWRYQVVTVKGAGSSASLGRRIVFENNAQRVAHKKVQKDGVVAVFLVDYEDKMIRPIYYTTEYVSKATKTVQELFPVSEGWNDTIIDYNR